MSDIKINDLEDDKSEKMKEVKRNASTASRKESFRRRNHAAGKAERINVDDRLSVDNNRDSSLLFKRHLLEALDYDPASMKNLVTAELRDIGVDIETCGRQSRSKTRKNGNVTPSTAIQSSVHGDEFLETVEIKLEGDVPVRLCIPSIVKQTCDFIRKEITTEGLFRKSGLTSRISSLKQRFAEKSCDVFTSEDTVFDATSALKQYLRELRSPLIPFDTHVPFLKCLECQDEKDRVEAILTCVFLLPLVNIHVLVYLMSFLHEVMNHSVQNKMGYKNIALVMTPNIMPLEEKKQLAKGKETIMSEKMALEKNRKVVEVLILYGDRVGWVPSRLFKALEVQFIYRNSDDELENDRGGREGRRKKRRSGSLTRMFGFFKKVTKGTETPSSVIDTPIRFAHTPVLKANTKKRGSDEPLFSVQKNPMKADWLLQTPDSLFSTPSISRDKKRSKSTPETLKLLPQSSSKSSAKNMRLGFGRKSGKKVETEYRSSEDDDDEVVSTALAPSFESSSCAKPTNAILSLSKYLKNFSLLPSRNLKSSISVGAKLSDLGESRHAIPKSPFVLSCSALSSLDASAMLHQQVHQNLLKANQELSTVSIHQLPQSPIKRVQNCEGETAADVTDSVSSSAARIPPPPEFCDPPKEHADESTRIINTCKAHATSRSEDEGEYVTIASDACACDPRNDAFIASSLSLDSTNVESVNGLESTASSKAVDDQPSPLDCLRLTPLIKEITTLTLNAQKEDEAELPPPLPPRADVATPLAERSNLPERIRTPRSGSRPANSMEEVAKEFRRTLNEEKLIKLKAEMAANAEKTRALQRRGSMHVANTRGVSPSKRRINSFRRRSYETKTSANGPFQSPRFMSLRSPRSRPVPPPPLVRSASRCTLRRGRPNTAWAGLPKPSPGRGGGNGRPEVPKRAPVSTVPVTAQRSLTQVSQGLTKSTRSPVIRRMSSVQELVHRLEKKGKISKSAVEVAPDRRPARPSTLNLRSSSRLSLPARSTRISDSSAIVVQAESSKDKAPKSVSISNPKDSTPNQSGSWTSGPQFDFEHPITPNAVTPVVGKRESLHFLKTKNAGRVSANIKMFDGIARQEPSTGSRIPRYTALHTIPSQRSLLPSSDE